MFCAMQDTFKIQPLICRKVHTSRSDMLTFITIARILQVLQIWFWFEILLHYNYRITGNNAVCTYSSDATAQSYRLGPL